MPVDRLTYIFLCITYCRCVQFSTSLDINATININYALVPGTGSCDTFITSISYWECINMFQNRTNNSNVMVYIRRFLLCKMCFVSQTLTQTQAIGSILAYYPITGTCNSSVNIAQGKPSNMSSSHFDVNKGYTSSGLAVDGIWESRLQSSNNFFCSHTAEGQQSDEHWWMVNLETIYPVSKVSILNRGDCCPERLRDLTITVGETANDMQLCAEYAGPGSRGEVVNITCLSSMYGQYVRISKPATEPLQMCEVAVYC
ncbi:fucolectin-7-like [Mercenaria mercenaria]|uniref:fucolectin-7-like n=1 Tax=Mercenaria mercenaria TaxID=6596 RepID=UPI00234FA3CD|nr:fucolectin-7-like [Mercenaria mercenaria]